MSIETLKLALEALDGHTSILGLTDREIDSRAITALRQAIDQAEKQEPVADINVRPPLKGGDGPLIASVLWHKLPVGSWLLYTAPPSRQKD